MRIYLYRCSECNVTTIRQDWEVSIIDGKVIPQELGRCAIIRPNEQVTQGCGGQVDYVGAVDVWE